MLNKLPGVLFILIGVAAAAEAVFARNAEPVGGTY